MPELARFYGIIISLYYDDHPPPHFHARYGSFRAKFDIRTGALIIGSMPSRARGFIEEWRITHLNELMENWTLAKDQQPLRKIEPLK
jgi:phosphomannomutase